MNKKPLNKEILQKTVKTTQAIEGYALAAEPIQKKMNKLKKQYGIKISTHK
jgi:hypothetical protein